MLLEFAAFILFFSGLIFGGNVAMLPALPNGGVANAVQVDAGGNIYVAGTQSGDGFVAKLAPDGSKIVYWTVVPGAGATGLAIGADGSAYFTGIGLSNLATTPG